VKNEAVFVHAWLFFLLPSRRKYFHLLPLVGQTLIGLGCGDLSNGSKEMPGHCGMLPAYVMPFCLFACGGCRQWAGCYDVPAFGSMASTCAHAY
jgi:hypothetical protein